MTVGNILVAAGSLIAFLAAFGVAFSSVLMVPLALGLAFAGIAFSGLVTR